MIILLEEVYPGATRKFAFHIVKAIIAYAVEDLGVRRTLGITHQYARSGMVWSSQNYYGKETKYPVAWLRTGVDQYLVLASFVDQSDQVLCVSSNMGLSTKADHEQDGPSWCSEICRICGVRSPCVIRKRDSLALLSQDERLCELPRLFCLPSFSELKTAGLGGPMTDSLAGSLPYYIKECNFQWQLHSLSLEFAEDMNDELTD